MKYFRGDKEVGGGSASPMALWDKKSACNAGNTGNMALIPGLDRSLGGREWQPTPVFLPKKNPMDRGAWWVTVQNVSKNPT